MEDVNDFSWQNTKSANAVLLCKMQRGVLTWKATNRIAQKCISELTKLEEECLWEQGVVL